jgi:quercetin dioxygenase-like cupin family protein
MAVPTPVIVGPRDGSFVDFGNLGVRFMVWGDDADRHFALVEHPIPPRTLATPLHRHEREDEYSYVLEGRMGALLGDDVVYGEPGDLIFKPRNQWHTFWNAGDAECRILELISPAGFERFFAEMGEASDSGGYADPTVVGARYGVEFDLDSIERICDDHGLRHQAPS